MKTSLQGVMYGDPYAHMLPPVLSSQHVAKMNVCHTWLS